MHILYFARGCNGILHWLTMKCSMLSLVRLVLLSLWIVPFSTSSCSDTRSLRDKISSCMHCSWTHTQNNCYLLHFFKEAMITTDPTDLLKVFYRGICAGQSCSPKHLQQRHGLLKDLPQSFSVGQNSLQTIRVQGLHTKLGLTGLLLPHYIWWGVLCLTSSLLCVWSSSVSEEPRHACRVVSIRLTSPRPSRICCCSALKSSTWPMTWRPLRFANDPSGASPSNSAWGSKVSAGGRDWEKMLKWILEELHKIMLHLLISKWSPLYSRLINLRQS